jgi:hypothetical protein
MTMPVRVQLRRTKGWRMPDNTTKVARPGPFGNPYHVGRDGDAATCVAAYRDWIVNDQIRLYGHERVLGKLRGKNLACFCALDTPCHADVLLELANAPVSGLALSKGSDV